MPAAIDCTCDLHTSRALVHAGLAALTAASVELTSFAESFVLHPSAKPETPSAPKAAIANFIFSTFLVISPSQAAEPLDVTQPTVSQTTDDRWLLQVGAGVAAPSSKTSRDEHIFLIRNFRCKRRRANARTLAKDATVTTRSSTQDTQRHLMSRHSCARVSGDRRTQSARLEWSVIGLKRRLARRHWLFTAPRAESRGERQIFTA
jgi:hypothetical protein